MSESSTGEGRVSKGARAIRGAGITVFMGLVYFAYLGIQSARTSAQFVRNKNNLRQIGIAIHNYHDTYSTLLMSTRNAQGIEQHGWETSLLPFMGSPGYIYHQSDFHQPWNAEINKPLFQLIDSGYISPSTNPQKDRDTGYALTSYSANKHLIDFNTSVRYRDIKDGLSSTLLIGEIRDELPPWGKPGNSRDPALGVNKSPKGFGGTFYNGCLFVMADGAVRHISETVDTKVIEALGTPAGGEKIDSNEF